MYTSSSSCRRCHPNFRDDQKSLMESPYYLGVLNDEEARKVQSVLPNKSVFLRYCVPCDLVIANIRTKKGEFKEISFIEKNKRFSVKQFNKKFNSYVFVDNNKLQGYMRAKIQLKKNPSEVMDILNQFTPTVDELYHKESKQSLSIHRAIFPFIVTAAFEMKGQAEKSAVLGKWIGHHFFVTNFNDKFRVYYLQGKPLYDEEHSQVWKAFSLKKGHWKAIKIGKTDTGDKAIQREVAIGKLMREKISPVPEAIAPSPKKALQVVVEGSPPRRFCKMQLFDEDLFQYSINSKNSSLKTKRLYSECLKLVKAVEVLHQQGFVHGDIKLENVLVRRLNGEITFSLIDFGGAKFLPDEKKLEFGFHSPDYLCQKDAHAFSETDDEEIKKDLRKKTDVFALAATVYRVVKKATPYITPEKNKYVDVDMAYLDEVLSSDNLTVQDFYRSGLNPDYKQRPTVSQLREKLESVVESLDN